MRPWHLIFVLGISLAFAGRIIAAETTAPSETHTEAAHADEFPHPEVSHDGGWAGAMGVIIILCFFLPAAIIGPIVRANTPEEVPPAHSHDEPPGSSGHHGASGTHTDLPHH